MKLAKEFRMKSSKQTDFAKTLATLVVMVAVSGAVWFGIRHFQTDITPVAKPVPKAEVKPHE